MPGKILKKLLLVLFFLLLISKPVFTQIDKKEQVRDVLINLFEYCANKDYSNAAKLLVYKGEDTARKGIDVYDYSLENDKRDVVLLSDKIMYLLENGGEFEFKEFKYKKDSQGDWYIWSVNFDKGKQQKVNFLFLKVKGEYALVDIGL